MQFQINIVHFLIISNISWHFTDLCSASSLPVSYLLFSVIFVEKVRVQPTNLCWMVAALSGAMSIECQHCQAVYLTVRGKMSDIYSPNSHWPSLCLTSITAVLPQCHSLEIIDWNFIVIAHKSTVLATALSYRKHFTSELFLYQGPVGWFQPLLCLCWRIIKFSK